MARRRLAIIAARVKPQRADVGDRRVDAAPAQIDFGERAGDRARQGEQTPRGLGRAARRTARWDREQGRGSPAAACSETPALRPWRRGWRRARD